MRGAWYVSNRAQGASARPLGPGNYTLSNHLLDTPWPKTRRLRQALDGFPVEQLGQSAQPVFDILRDTTQADDGDLPGTGIPRHSARLLTSPIIITPYYGTRFSTVLSLHSGGRSFFS